MSGSGEFVIPFKNLPAGFAETIADPPTVPVTPVPAATIVLLRDEEAGLELLLMRRSPKSGFVPGAYVFPGGRVDKPDSLPELVSRLDNLDRDSAEKRLGKSEEPPAIAYYFAALREAFEETGILIGVQKDGSAPATAAEDSSVDKIRDALMSDRINFHEALQQLGCRITGDKVEYIADWLLNQVSVEEAGVVLPAASAKDALFECCELQVSIECVLHSSGDVRQLLDDGSLDVLAVK